jgi:nitrate reductase alpha subunit
VARRSAQGKLDLLVTLDFRMSTTCVYSDIVLPTATWYEKDDLNTSDMHPSSTRCRRRWIRWESRSDWDIYKGIAKKFSEVAPEVLGVEQDVVLTPIQHDSPNEMAQPLTWPTGRRDEASRSRQDHANVAWSSATIPTSTSASPRSAR